MPKPSRRELELNELEWWSNWAKLSWLGKNAHLLTSREFNEPFFNRAGFIVCSDLSASVDKAERAFRNLGMNPVLLVYESCSNGMKVLSRKGYRLVDTMTVLVSTGALSRPNRPSDVRPSSSISSEDWSRAYLKSFYGDERLMPVVTRIVRRLQRAREATFLEARLEGQVAGVLAIYRTKGLAGIYCVGTLPRFRRRGVAGALTARAKEIATKEGRKLILQTLESDGAEPFYTARGFRKLYRKNLMVKEN